MSIIAKTFKDIQSNKGEIRAGGTDLMERIRHRVSKGEVVDISRIPGLSEVTPTNFGLKIGALVTIDTVANDPDLKTHFPGLAMAAGSLATPQIRRAASMGGGILQRNRCWYFRHEDFICLKKGGTECFAREGNHQFGVCFDLGPCVFPHPSTLGMVLMAYDADVEIYEKERIKVLDLYGDGKTAAHDHLLAAGDVLTHIHLPPPMRKEKAAYFRTTSRARAEWPLVEAIVRYRLEGDKIAEARVAIGGVAPVPLLLPEVDAYLTGKTPSEAVFKEAGNIAAKGANPLPMTGYKVQLVRNTVYETLRRAEARIWGGED